MPAVLGMDGEDACVCGDVVRVHVIREQAKRKKTGAFRSVHNTGLRDREPPPSEISCKLKLLYVVTHRWIEYEI